MPGRVRRRRARLRANRPTPSPLADEKPSPLLLPRTLARETDVGDHGVDRQARHQPIGIAAAGDRRNVEPETAKGPGPLGGFHRDAVLATEAVGNDGHCARGWEAHARTVAVDGVRQAVPAALPSHPPSLRRRAPGSRTGWCKRGR